MVKRLLTVLLSALLTAASADDIDPRYDTWANAPLGIAVTRCDYSTRGVHVRFETDLEPPYVVGIYRPREEGLGRRFPIAEVETWQKDAFVPGNFTDVAVFVQVMTKDVVTRYANDGIGHRELTRAEWREYEKTISEAAPYINTNANFTFEIDYGTYMEIVEDYTWAGFLRSDETNLCFTLSGRKAEKTGDGDYRMVPQEYTFRIRHGRNDVGTGYRIMMFEDTGVCQAQRAYSALTNMSDVVVLPAGFRALSSHNGYIFTTDWEGRRYFQKITNRVDHVFGK